MNIRGAENTDCTFSHVTLQCFVFPISVLYSVGGACAWQWRQGACLRASLGPCVGDGDAVH